MATTAFAEAPDRPYIGWIVGGVIVLLVLVVGFGFWFLHHP